MSRLAAAVTMAAVLLAPLAAWALDWDQLWLNDDQRAAKRMEQEDYAAAADTFDDPRWRAAARYRAGEYQRAAAAWAAEDSTRAHYNRGTALARAGDIEAAIEAYETVLARAPDHADARYNLALLRELARDREQNQEQDRDAPGSPENQAQRQTDSDGDRRDELDRGGQQQAGGQGDNAREEQSADRAGGSQDTGQQAGNRPDTGTSGQPAPRPPGDEPPAQAGGRPEADSGLAEQQASLDQWLRRVPDDPGGLLRRKFLYQYQRRERGDGVDEPW